MFGRISLEKVKRAMTQPFTKIEQLNNYMVRHLYSLYDQIEGNDWDNLENDYVMGSIDTTQHYLIKSGVEFLDQTEYIEKVEGAKWTTI